MSQYSDAELADITIRHAAWVAAGCRGDGQVNLSRANLRKADLRGVNLSRAHLSRADFRRADLSGADLSGADLSGADLSQANLREADLSGAYLSGADLRWANLRGANLSLANLSGAIGAWCAGTDPRGHRFVGVQHPYTRMVAADFRWFTIAEARAHWANNPDALARIGVIEAQP